MRKVLIIGGGGREYALALRLSQENAEVFVLPGNAGTEQFAANIDLPLEGAKDFEAVAERIRKEGIDLVVVGPEKYLEMGIVDFLEDRGILCFGTRKAASLLESSKVYAKEFMIRYGIPTARYHMCTSMEEVLVESTAYRYPIVLKADGLAAGKGVIICEDEMELRGAAETLFGISPKVVMEEFIRGTEASVMCFVDGETIRPMQPARDHKRLLDGDHGPNTGGMGAISGPTILPNAVAHRFDVEVADRFMDGIKDAGIDFRGVLFVGLMYRESGEVYVLEFNTRFGDPETEVVLPGIDGSLYDLLEATAKKKLSSCNLRLNGMYNAVVVLAAGEYPYSKTVPVEIRTDAAEGEMSYRNILHCGTSRDAAGRLLATGGRVLACLGSGDSLDEAIEEAYRHVRTVSFEGMRFRKDIGRTVDL